MPSKSTPQAEFEKLSPTAWKVTVDVPPEIFRRKLDGVYNELSKNASIPGFRPGKAPKNVLNRHFGGERILGDAYEDVIEETLWPVLKEKELILIGRPRVDHDKWKDGEDFRYTAKLEIVPPIPEVDYSVLKAILPEREMTDEILDEEMRRVSLRFGESKEIEDRTVQENDLLLIHFEGEVPEVEVESIEGKIPWKHVNGNMELEVGRGKAIDGLEEQLVGMELEEVKEFELVLGDDFPDPRVRGKTLKAQARILKINEIKPVELTDELVREKLGEQEIETVDTLKERLTTEIQNHWEQMDSRATTDQLEAYLSRAFDFPLPEGLVRHRYDDILDRSLDALKQGGTDIDEVMEDGNEAGEKIRKRARYQAERLVRLDLIMREIARKESIKVPPEEVANYLMMLALRQGLSEKDMRTLMQDPQFIDATKEEMLQKKVTHFLLDKVKPERVKEDEFRTMMEEAREEGEANERNYLDTIDDPLVTMKEDYMADATSSEEAGAVEEKVTEEPK